jgi:hypothetical protein
MGVMTADKAILIVAIGIAEIVTAAVPITTSVKRSSI